MYPDVIPMIAYENGTAALDWLADAFGFRELTRMTGPDGTLAHGEMEAGGGVIMLATPTPDYESPKHHREACAQARKWSTARSETPKSSAGCRQAGDEHPAV